MLKVGSDFSGVGAFNQALTRLGVEYQEVFACDMDKYARQTFIHNYGEPKYYPTNVYDREIPLESLDIYMTSPPCQAFSLAGKRLGKDDKRGILFFNSYEFIQVNQPRFFIFENVKGLLSDDGGNTFQEWINMLGGRSVNGLPILFPYDNALPYHLYWQVLNAKHHGVPQNRERVFLIGIRDDKDNNFRFPAEEHLSKRLKDVLEEEVNDKYFLSEKMVNVLTHHKNPIITNNLPNQSASILASYFKMGGRDQQYLKINSATSKGYEEATEGDSINFSVPNSETRRGRVGKGVAQTLDTGCNQGVMVSKEVRTQESKYERKKTGSNNFRGKEIEFRNQYHMNAITTSLTNDHLIESNYKIRRLTPRECFRLMDFPDTFTWPVSDSQAYKQAGNSIVVRVLEKIIKNLLQI
jgi:DNA (cytosine-5)-methyltransferase 1